jgi:Helicase conserved C-terminal domain
VVSLADNLRALGDDQLAYLLTARPELADPPPATMNDLAQRASAPYSVQRCLQGQNALAVQLLHALVLLGAGANVAAIAGLAEIPVDHEVLTAELGRLRSLGLVSMSNGIYTAIPSVARSVGRPFGLGDSLEHSFDRHGPNDLRVIAENLGITPVVGKVGLIRLISDHLRDPARFVEVLRRLPAATLSELTEIVASGSAMVRVPGLMQRSRVSIESAQLLSHGLLVPVDWDVAEVPREISLMLKNGHALTAFRSLPPEIVGESRRPDVDEVAPATVVEYAARLLLSWGEQPAAMLKAGGVGVTVVKAVAKDLGIDASFAARLIALCESAGLIGMDYISGTARPSKHADGWFALNGPQRYLALIEGWRSHPVDFVRYTTADSGIAPLRHEAMGNAPWRRARMFAALAVSTHTGFVDIDSVVQHVQWTGPSYWQTGEAAPDLLVTGILEELYLFGLTRNGVLSEVARSLAVNDTAGAEFALQHAFPEASDTFMVQADLTAIAPGELRTDVAAELSVLADVESRGGATMLRFSEASLRRAMDRGRTAETILAFLDAHARPMVPQPLRYLIDDVSRRHGQLRIGTTTTYLRADDPALLAAVVNHRKMTKAGLHLISPTVAISSLEEPKLLKMMRENGFLPMPELPDGTPAPVVAMKGREVFDRDLGERGRVDGLRAWNEGLNAAGGRSVIPSQNTVKLAARLRAR